MPIFPDIAASDAVVLTMRAFGGVGCQARISSSTMNEGRGFNQGHSKLQAFSVKEVLSCSYLYPNDSRTHTLGFLGVSQTVGRETLVWRRCWRVCQMTGNPRTASLVAMPCDDGNQADGCRSQSETLGREAMYFIGRDFDALRVTMIV